MKRPGPQLGPGLSRVQSDHHPDQHGPTSSTGHPHDPARRAPPEYEITGAAVHNTSSPGACPGICNSAWRRAESVRLVETATHDLTPRAGNPVWCQPCARYVRSELDALPHLAARLLLEVDNATGSGSEHVSGSKHRPIHAREKFVFCIGDIDDVLDGWAVVVREDRRLATARPTRQGPRISASTALLLTHFDWLINEHPDPEASREFGAEIRRVYRHSSRLTHTDDVRAERCDGVPCPRCDLMMLEREIDVAGRGTGYIACRNCSNLLSPAEYERWTKLVAAPLRKAAA